MPSAHRESVRDFATVNQDIQMDIVQQVVERRKTLGYTQLQLAEAARITEMDLQLFEQGGVFEDSHVIVCDILEALLGLEEERESTPSPRLVIMRVRKI